MIKKIFYILSLSLIIPKITTAICPVCTVAVGAGLGLSRWLGIDDIISSLWIGGFIISLIMWTNFWLDKKNIQFKYRNYLTGILYYILIILPLYLTGIIGHPFNQLWEIDKIILGIFFGSKASKYVFEKRGSSEEIEPGREKLVLDMIAAKGQVTRQMVADEFNFSRATAGRLLVGLEDRGLVVRKGEGKGVYYILSTPSKTP